MPVGFRYSRWDGTQAGFELEADDILSEITDDLLYHGDLNAALRRLMQSGFRDRNDERVKGIRELMEQLRRRRRDDSNTFQEPRRPGEPRHGAHPARPTRRGDARAGADRRG